MTQPESENESPADTELAELPAPRRPWRGTTLLVLWLGAAGSLWLAVSMLPDVAYALRGGDPVELGEFGNKPLPPKLANRWVQGEGELSVSKAIRYRRPLESDSYRLAALSENPRLWIQVRVPRNDEGPRFVPPASFVGRLVPIGELGVRHGALPGALAKAGLGPPGDDAWVLLDGESPQGLRWVLGLLVLLLAFAAFNVVGLLRLLRPISPATGRAR
ncbi:MAG TPA: hypothetical protein VFZ53_26710 [Polyangiaceae bacterium]